MTKVTLVRVTLLAAMLGLPLYWWAFPPREPIEAANGQYVSACCGVIGLHDGLMILSKNQYVRYVVEHDKAGRYVLPISYVGVSERSLIIRRTGYPLKLRIDENLNPKRIDLLDDNSGEVFSFERVKGR